MNTYSIISCQTVSDYESAATVTRDYLASLDFDISFQHIDDELATFQTMYGRPDGCYLLSYWMDHVIAGGVGFRRLSSKYCEMKRLFIYPPYRKQGIGRTLCQELLKQAQLRTYKFMRLDIMNRSMAANHLYEKLGFYDISSYCENPYPTARFMEIDLAVIHI